MVGKRLTNALGGVKVGWKKNTFVDFIGLKRKNPESDFFFFF
jgi:hypothetical protein